MNGYKPRRETRTKVLIRSQLRGAGPERDACVLDLSTCGLLATCENPPGRGDFVELIVNGHPLVGQVKWSRGRRFGLSLRERVSVIALVANDGEPIRLPERRAVPRPDKSAMAAITADASNVGRFGTFLTWILAALVAGMLLMGVAESALGALDQASEAMAAKA